MNQEEIINEIGRKLKMHASDIQSWEGVDFTNFVLNEYFKYKQISNLEEAAEDFEQNNPPKSYWLEGDFVTESISLSDAFKAGAQWVFNQLQKVEGKPIDWYMTGDDEFAEGIVFNESIKWPAEIYIKNGKENS